ncbi:HAD-IC family P-type ATPase, partial [Acinetobacter baumannii]|uniref:HAD-IC family P-type ATPase n=1 Tax=Acinetobacter baumannii TaxID=470 RepID=UPI001F0B32C7
MQNEQGIAGMLALQDTLRPEAVETVAQLKALGIMTVMLTGDRQPTAHAIAAEAGVDEVYAELLPEQKLASIKELGKRYGKVAMIGDGVNDTPA